VAVTRTARCRATVNCTAVSISLLMLREGRTRRRAHALRPVTNSNSCDGVSFESYGACNTDRAASVSAEAAHLDDSRASTRLGVGGTASQISEVRHGEVLGELLRMAVAQPLPFAEAPGYCQQLRPAPRMAGERGADVVRKSAKRRSIARGCDALGARARSQGAASQKSVSDAISQKKSCPAEVLCIRHRAMSRSELPHGLQGP